MRNVISTALTVFIGANDKKRTGFWNFPLSSSCVCACRSPFRSCRLIKFANRSLALEMAKRAKRRCAASMWALIAKTPRPHTQTQRICESHEKHEGRGRNCEIRLNDLFRDILSSAPCVWLVAIMAKVERVAKKRREQKNNLLYKMIVVYSI